MFTASLPLIRMIPVCRSCCCTSLLSFEEASDVLSVFAYSFSPQSCSWRFPQGTRWYEAVLTGVCLYAHLEDDRVSAEHCAILFFWQSASACSCLALAHLWATLQLVHGCPEVNLCILPVYACALVPPQCCYPLSSSWPFAYLSMGNCFHLFCCRCVALRLAYSVLGKASNASSCI